MQPSGDLHAYRTHPRELERIARFFTLLPAHGPNVLDIGARDGHLSVLLAERFDHVVALDLSPPSVDHPRVQALQGDACALPFADNTFHTVVCAEVLEHIPAALLPKACSEIMRVASQCAVIGVPYRQDLRVACTTCYHCGTVNPPWGHVNSFDEQALCRLMKRALPARQDYVGRTREATNRLAAALMNYAGNPYGTYEQDEPCVSCGRLLTPPPARSLPQRVATRLATWALSVQKIFTPWHASWLHARFEKV